MFRRLLSTHALADTLLIRLMVGGVSYNYRISRP